MSLRDAFAADALVIADPEGLGEWVDYRPRGVGPPRAVLAVVDRQPPEPLTSRSTTLQAGARPDVEAHLLNHPEKGVTSVNTGDTIELSDPLPLPGAATNEGKTRLTITLVIGADSGFFRVRLR